jgi:hypothetical protein
VFESRASAQRGFWPKPRRLHLRRDRTNQTHPNHHPARLLSDTACSRIWTNLFLLLLLLHRLLHSSSRSPSTSTSTSGIVQMIGSCAGCLALHHAIAHEILPEPLRGHVLLGLFEVCLDTFRTRIRRVHAGTAAKALRGGLRERVHPNVQVHFAIICRLASILRSEGDRLPLVRLLVICAARRNDERLHSRPKPLTSERFDELFLSADLDDFFRHLGTVMSDEGERRKVGGRREGWERKERGKKRPIVQREEPFVQRR